MRVEARGRFGLSYRCTGCRRVLARRERVFLDDPQAPFGPEWVCPSCGSSVALHARPAAACLAGVAAGSLGLAVGYVLSRWSS